MHITSAPIANTIETQHGGTLIEADLHGSRAWLAHQLPPAQALKVAREIAHGRSEVEFFTESEAVLVKRDPETRELVTETIGHRREVKRGDVLNFNTYAHSGKCTDR